MASLRCLSAIIENLKDHSSVGHSQVNVGVRQTILFFHKPLALYVSMTQGMELSRLYPHPLKLPPPLVKVP